MTTFYSKKEAKQLVERCYCPKHKTLLWRSPTGAVCPDCKYFSFGVSTQELRSASIAIKVLDETLPIATQDSPGTRRYIVNGKLYLNCIREKGEVEVLLNKGTRFAPGKLRLPLAKTRNTQLS